MAKIRADIPMMETSRSSEVGEIDTRAPFQSVRAALSLFRQFSFSKQPPPRLSSSSSSPSKQQPPRLSSSSSSQDAAPDVSDKETQLLCAEQEMDRVKISLDGSVKAKAQALSDLDFVQRKAADLRIKLESTKQSKKFAIQTKRIMDQKLEKLQSENLETESVRENYILVISELFMAKEELGELKKQFSLTVEERLAELQRGEEAECVSKVNSQKIKDMSQEIVEMRDFAEKLKNDASRKKEEEEKINQERIDAGETYSAMKLEAEKRLEDLKQDCNPELRKDIEELAEISAENDGLQEKIRLVRELKETKRVMQEIFEEESSYRSLVSSLTMELDKLQKENRDLKEKENEIQKVEEEERIESSRKVEETINETEKTRKETEEIRNQVENLRREEASTHIAMNESINQLEIVLRAMKKAKSAEKRAVEDMKVLTDTKESLTQDEPDKKIRISLKEYEDLRDKHEESEIMVKLKAKNVAAQLEEINQSRIEGERMLEEKMKEMEEVKAAIDVALRNAEIVEEASCIVDAELRKWKPQEL